MLAASRCCLLHNAYAVLSALRVAGEQQGVHVFFAAPLGGSAQLVFTCRLSRRVLEETVFSWESLKCMSTRLTAAGSALGPVGKTTEEERG